MVGLAKDDAALRGSSSWRRPEIVLAPAGQVAAWAASVAPGLTAAVLHAVSHLLLPDPAGPRGMAAFGKRLHPAISPAAFDWLTLLGRQAALALNENAKSVP